MEKLGIRAADDGKTLFGPAARVMSVATQWKHMGAFEAFLVKRLAGPPAPQRT